MIFWRSGEQNRVLFSAKVASTLLHTLGCSLWSWQKPQFWLKKDWICNTQGPGIVVKTVPLANGSFLSCRHPPFSSFSSIWGAWRAKSLVFVGRVRYRNFADFREDHRFSAGGKNTVLQNDRFDNPDFCAGTAKKLPQPDRSWARQFVAFPPSGRFSSKTMDLRPRTGILRVFWLI